MRMVTNCYSGSGAPPRSDRIDSPVRPGPLLRLRQPGRDPRGQRRIPGRDGHRRRRAERVGEVDLRRAARRGAEPTARFGHSPRAARSGRATTLDPGCPPGDGPRRRRDRNLEAGRSARRAAGRRHGGDRPCRPDRPRGPYVRRTLRRAAPARATGSRHRPARGDPAARRTRRGTRRRQPAAHPRTPHRGGRPRRHDRVRHP